MSQNETMLHEIAKICDKLNLIRCGMTPLMPKKCCGCAELHLVMLYFGKLPLTLKKGPFPKSSDPLPHTNDNLTDASTY